MFSRIRKSQPGPPSISRNAGPALAGVTPCSPVELELFSGRADLPRLMALPYGQLPADEQAFLDGPVRELLQLADTAGFTRHQRVPQPLFDFMAEKGFFGLQIPTGFGGRPMSALGRSCVIARLTSHSTLLGSLVAMANSGIAELLHTHGTEAQKAHYLPRLARGEQLPCLALTRPFTPAAMSAAASAGHAEGEVFRASDGSVNLRLNFHRRCVPFAPLANLLVLACTLHDPAQLLGAATSGCALILLDTTTAGLVIGNTGPADASGTVIGHEVIVPATTLLGERAGGRHSDDTMLAPSPVIQRAVTSAAVAAATLQYTTAAAATYTAVRGQRPSARLGHLAATSYLFEAGRVFSCTALDREQSSLITSRSIAMCMAEAATEAVEHAGELMAEASSRSPVRHNTPRRTAPTTAVLAAAHSKQRMLVALADTPSDGGTTPDIIIRARSAGTSFGVARLLIALLLALGRGLSHGHLFTRLPDTPSATGRYHRRISRGASRLALLLALAARSRALTPTARNAFAGALDRAATWHYLALATLRRFDADGRPADDLPLIHYSCRYALAQAEHHLGRSAHHLPGLAGAWLRAAGRLAQALNPLSRQPTPRWSRAAAATLWGDLEQQQRLCDAILLPTDPRAGLGALLHASRLRGDTQAIRDKLDQAQRAGRLAPGEPEAQLAQATERMILTRTEAALLRAAHHAGRMALEGEAEAIVQSMAASASPLPASAHAAPPRVSASATMWK